MRSLSKLMVPVVVVAALGAAGPAVAQQKLKWAHVYETTEPYHTESVWAASEIKKRTNGKFDIEVFPASTLGRETDLNQGMTLGTVDMIISGPSFAARTYPRLGIAYYPFIFRDADHLLAYSKSPIFAEMVEGFRAKTGIQITAYTTQVAPHVWSKLTDQEKRIFTEVTQEAARRATDQIKKRESELADEFRKKGLLIVAVNRQSVIDAILKATTPESLGFTKSDYDRIVAIK